LDGVRTPSVPHGTDEAEDRHSNFYDAWVNLLELPIATAENPRGAARPAFSDLSEGMSLVGVPKAIGNAENGTPVTMEEVADRLTSALLKGGVEQGCPWA